MDELYLKGEIISLFIMGALILAFYLIFKFFKKLKRNNLKGKYKEASLLTPNEKKAMREILSVTNNLNLLTFCKVRMIDVVSPKGGKDYNFYRNKVLSKHFDFVIADERFNVVLVIELDDSSHETKEAKERDNIKNVILKDVGIPLLRCCEINKEELYHILKRLL